jgi:hypothetical protein
MDVYIQIFVTSALAGGEWSASRPGRFIPGERVPGIHWIGGWVDTRTGLDDVEKRKFLTLQDSKSDPSVVQPGRYTDNAIPAQHFITQLPKSYRIVDTDSLDFFINKVSL